MLVLGMPGDRATVVSQGTVDMRVELADTASIFNELNPQSGAVMKLETLRSGLFVRYVVADRLEVALEVPGLYCYQGLGSNSKCNTTGPDGLRWCQAKELLYTCVRKTVRP